MRFLHTGDWHVGKMLKGRNRLDEQAAVLAEIVDIACRERVDPLAARDVHDLREDGRLLVEPVPALEHLADMPVACMEETHS